MANSKKMGEDNMEKDGLLCKPGKKPTIISKRNTRSSAKKEKIAVKENVLQNVLHSLLQAPLKDRNNEEPKTVKRRKYQVDGTDINLEVLEFQHYLRNHIKIGGKLNNLGGKIRFKNKEKVVHIKCQVYVAKKYIRFLTNNYLKKMVNQKVRIVSNSKNSYKLVYANK